MKKLTDAVFAVCNVSQYGRNLVMIGMHNPAHPGEVLQDWLEGMSVTEVAKHLGVSRVGLSRVLHGQTGISPEMSIKLSEALGASPDLWFKMQANDDFWIASRRKRTKVGRLKRAA